MAEPLDTLQLKIQSDASAAAEGLKSLKDALSKLKSSVSRGQLNLANVADEISKFASAVNSVNIDKIERLAEAMTKIKSASSGFASGAKKAAKAAEEARKEAEKATDTGRSSTGRREQTGTASPEEHGNRGPWRRRTETVSGTDDREQRLQQARAILASAEQAREIVEQISSRIGPVVSKALGSVASYAKTIIGVVEGIGRAFLKCGEIAKTAFLAPMRYIANGVTKIYKTITGLIRSVARIALYRAIRTAIKAVTQGLNEGMQNLYQWSLLMDRTFANSMDSIASSMQYLHNGFASMFSPLINYAAPIIEEVTNRLVDFFNVVQQIFATLTGASTWTKAIRVQKQYAEAVTDTGKAADKAMHQVMAFDELNIINSPTDSGRAGVGANTPNYASMFVTQEVETGLKSWVAEIKKFFESGDFRGLGEYVGEKLNELVNKWNSYDKGFKFGERIKHALEALNGFLATFNFYNLGQKVGDWIAGLIDGMDPNLIAETIARSIDAAVSGLNGLISKLNERQVPQKIGMAIGKAFATVNWQGVADLAQNILTGIVHFVNSAASSFITNGGPQKLINAAKEIGRAIGEAFATVNWRDVTTVVTSIFTGIVTLLSNAISQFVKMGGPEKLRAVMGQIGIAIGEAFANIRGKDLAEIINAIAGGILDMFKNAFTAFSKGNGWKELGKFIQNLDWGTLLTLTLPLLTIKILGVTLKGVLSSMILRAVASNIASTVTGGAASAGVGGIAMTATGLVIPLMVLGTVMWMKNSGFDEYMNELFGNVPSTVAKKSDGNIVDFQSTRTGTGKAIMDAGRSQFYDNVLKPTLQKIVKWCEENEVVQWMKETPEGYKNGLSWDLKVAGQGTGGGNPMYKNTMVRYSASIPFELDLSKVSEAANSSDLPAKMEQLARTSGNAAKRGFDESNVPGKLREIVNASLNEFASKDFSPGGRHAGDTIKSGFNSSNVASVVSTAAQNAINAFKSANWAGTGSTAGASLGSSFKSAFASHAKATLMLQTAAGKPITQAYVVPYAQGGFVQGSLFLAGEVAGQAEMVGSINGRTGVASGEEITGIREAVESTGNAEASLLGQLVTIGQALLLKDPFGTPNSAAGRWIAQSQQAYKAVTG